MSAEENTQGTSASPAQPDSGLRWYVVRAISGKEKKVKQYIELEISRLKMQDKVAQVLIPTEKIYQIRNGKKISKERSFFPGYILIQANLEGEVAHIIKNVNGVIGFLGDRKNNPELDELNRELGKIKNAINALKAEGESPLDPRPEIYAAKELELQAKIKSLGPVPLRQAELNRILGKVDQLAEKDEQITIPFIVGETVKVVDGPFNSFSGIIEEINEEKKKLKVMVKIFGRKTPLELSYMQVEKE